MSRLFETLTHSLTTQQKKVQLYKEEFGNQSINQEEEEEEEEEEKLKV